MMMVVTWRNIQLTPLSSNVIYIATHLAYQKPVGIGYMYISQVTQTHGAKNTVILIRSKSYTMLIIGSTNNIIGRLVILLISFPCWQWDLQVNLCLDHTLGKNYMIDEQAVFSFLYIVCVWQHQLVTGQYVKNMYTCTYMYMAVLCVFV